MLKEALIKRKVQYTTRLGELAYERLLLIRRLEDIDRAIQQLEGAKIETEQALRDASTEEEIQKALQEKILQVQEANNGTKDQEGNGAKEKTGRQKSSKGGVAHPKN